MKTKKKTRTMRSTRARKRVVEEEGVAEGWRRSGCCEAFSCDGPCAGAFWPLCARVDSLTCGLAWEQQQQQQQRLLWWC